MAAIEYINRQAFDPTAGGADLVPIVPSDALDQLPGEFFRGLLIQTAGTLVIITPKGTTRTLPSGLLAANVIHAVPFTRVMATGTTAVVWGVP